MFIDKSIVILIGMTIGILWTTFIIVVHINQRTKFIKNYIKEYFDDINVKLYEVLNNLDKVNNDILTDTDIIIKQNNIINSYCDKINKQLDTISKVTDSTNNRVKSMQNKAKFSLNTKRMNNTSFVVNKSNNKLETAEK